MSVSLGILGSVAEVRTAPLPVVPADRVELQVCRPGRS